MFLLCAADTKLVRPVRSRAILRFASASIRDQSCHRVLARNAGASVRRRGITAKDRCTCDVDRAREDTPWNTIAPVLQVLQKNLRGHVRWNATNGKRLAGESWAVGGGKSGTNEHCDVLRLGPTLRLETAARLRHYSAVAWSVTPVMTKPCWSVPERQGRPVSFQAAAVS